MKNAKLALVFALIFILLLSLFYFLSTPDISNLKKQNPKKTAFMEYRERESQDRQEILSPWSPSLCGEM